MKTTVWRFAVAAGMAAWIAAPADGYVEALYPLQQVLNESTVIAEGVIEKADPQKKIAVVKITRSLKGKCHYEHIRMNFGGGQFYFPEVIMRHMVVGAPALIFYNDGRQGEIYINRFFNQIYGDGGAPPDKAWWNFTHVEIRMNRTFNGSVPELSDTVQKILAGKMKAPAPDAKIPPIDKPTLIALPVHGEPVDEAALPAPFAKRAVKLGKPRDPENPAGVVPGLSYQYYEGVWTAIPDFASLKPAKTGTTPTFDAGLRVRQIHYGFRFTGFIEVPKEGIYSFITSSNDGSKLYIGKQEVVSNDHFHGVVEAFGEIALKAGKHAITVDYFEGGGSTALDVFWEGPDMPRQKIEPKSLFHAPAP